MKLLHDPSPREPNRPSPTFLQKINPWFWLCDTERNMAWSWWRWFKRNPAHNFKAVVIGVGHKTRTCHYSHSALTYAVKGWNMGYTSVRWYPPLLFISHRGEKIEWCIGWMTNGACTIERRTANSPNASPA